MVFQILRLGQAGGEDSWIKDAKRAQAEACALKTDTTVAKLAHEAVRSETSNIFDNEIDHIQHEVHSFLIIFLYHSIGKTRCQVCIQRNISKEDAGLRCHRRKQKFTKS